MVGNLVGNPEELFSYKEAHMILSRFAINLKCDDDDEGDIALHFNPRFEEREVVRNNRVGGDWQNEEREQGDDFPFEKKDAFEIAINVKEDRFVVCFFSRGYNMLGLSGHFSFLLFISLLLLCVHDVETI